MLKHKKTIFHFGFHFERSKRDIGKNTTRDVEREQVNTCDKKCHDQICFISSKQKQGNKNKTMSL